MLGDHVVDFDLPEGHFVVGGVVATEVRDFQSKRVRGTGDHFRFGIACGVHASLSSRSKVFLHDEVVGVDAVLAVVIGGFGFCL